MKTVKLETTAMKGQEGERSMSIDWNVPEGFDEIVQAFAAPVVFNGFMDSYTIAAQAFLRGKMKPQGTEGKRLTDAEIATLFKAWKYQPGTKGDPVKRVEKAKSLFASISDDQRAALVEAYNRGEFVGRSMTNAGDVTKTDKPGNKPQVSKKH